jgi:hypothetical protein
LELAQDADVEHAMWEARWHDANYTFLAKVFFLD